MNNYIKILPPQVLQARTIEFHLYNIPGIVNGFTDDVHALWNNVQDTTPDVF